ncbi:hypothetical protein K437DRAFT_247900 [Tilletiaria anomala UBC 951]|uniref:Coenzyme Q-binding protein COQ10 START domain-containing protein n=1 Tax=Tilletiaria anomala (strain ATCC 24038 / CBS 436.72 / UBC 951) TaxID=1037660 RepID=A0A066VRZ4_TILAU|nr:uncharacterized protein K437DRAFT_247900 [Tilletiaria anomala UBC 951]KDN44251.1 hypothetical protein K437DRAFT_247900 [Tilletiaria anomala UBC 951]
MLNIASRPLSRRGAQALASAQAPSRAPAICRRCLLHTSCSFPSWGQRTDDVVAVPPRSIADASRSRNGNRDVWLQRQQQKRYFTLPDLSKLASTLNPVGSGRDGTPRNVQTFKQSRDMPYTPQELYAIVANVDSYHLFLPYCTHSQVVGPDPSVVVENDHQVVLADLGIGFGSFQEKYRSRVELHQDRTVMASALPDSNLIFTQLSTTWSFSPAPAATSGRDQTRIHFQLDYAFSNPMYALVAGQVFEKTSQMVMHAFEKRAAEVYGLRVRQSAPH